MSGKSKNQPKNAKQVTNRDVTTPNESKKANSDGFHVTPKNKLIQHMIECVDSYTSEILNQERNRTYDKSINDYCDRVSVNVYDENGRIFMERESYLTILFRNKHINTIFNISVAIFLLSLDNMFYKYTFVQPEKFQLISDLMFYIIDNLVQALLIALHQLIMALIFYIIYSIFHKSMCSRFTAFHNKFILIAWFLIFSAYIVIFFCMTVNDLNSKPGLGFVFQFSLIIEQVRYTMKMYSFLRENVFKSIKIQSKHNVGFTEYIYFLFCPVLVYRYKYPRKQSTRWDMVFYHFCGTIAMAIFLCVIIQVQILPNFKNLEFEQVTFKRMLELSLECCLPATFLFFLVFFGFFHSWLNGWAEILRFGDRLFYNDWWTVTSYSGFYKNWNIVVHDWLKTYVLREMRVANLFSPRLSYIIASIVTIILSAIVHELVMYLTIGSFCPAFLILFGFVGVIVLFIRPNFTSKQMSNLGNVFHWLSFIFGNGILLSFYVGEHYLTKHCPRWNDETLLEAFVPRMLYNKCLNQE